MLTMLTTLIFLTLAVCMLTAAWPLLALPKVRLAAAGASGSCLVAGSASVMGLLVGGFVSLPEFGSVARAAESSTSEAAQETAVLAATDVKPEPAAGKPADKTIDGSSDAASSQSSAEPADPVIETPSAVTVIIPPGRPSWVESAPAFVGNTHTVAVSSDPFARRVDARKALDAKLVEATNAYIADHLGSELAPTFLRYDARTIKQRFVRPENVYEETIVVSIGPMHQSHALVEFGPEFRGEVERSWNRVRSTSRMTQLGLFGAAGLLLLGSVFSYFRLDTATRGYYTGRLQFMTAAAILAIIAAGAFAARWITWL